MNDFLTVIPRPDLLVSSEAQPHPLRGKTLSAYRRPDTYRALADLLGVSAPHVYQVLRGERVTTPARRRIIRDWAANHSRAGRSEAPAVAAALNLSAPKN